MKSGLPLLMRVADRPVMLIGQGEAADAKRRILERAGARIVGEDSAAALAIVAIEDDDEAQAAVARVKARGVLVNAVDRPALCDFTLPAIVDRDPVLIAISTGGASAGMAAAIRQRLEDRVPTGLGALAATLASLRERIRSVFPDAGQRRRALAAAFAEGGPLDPFADHEPDAVTDWLADPQAPVASSLFPLTLHSIDPGDLTLHQARALASADRVFHRPGVPAALLNRARADAPRIACDAAPADPGPGLSVDLALSA